MRDQKKKKGGSRYQAIMNAVKLDPPKPDIDKILESSEPEKELESFFKSMPAPNALLQEVADLSDTHAIRARYDPKAFIDFVLRDEENGGYLDIRPMHREWQDLISRYNRIVLFAHFESGKTQQISIGRVLYELGKDATLRVAIVSNTQKLARKISRSIARLITGSPYLHKVFPALMPDPKMPWTADELYIERGQIASIAKDPSVQVCGVHGNITGSRIDLLIIDDILDYEIALSQHHRDDLDNWFRSTLESRLTKNARIICVGTAWHTDDLMHRLSRRKNWVSVCYPVEVGGLALWPKRWPTDRIAEKIENLGPLESSRQLYCRAKRDEDQRFRVEWIDACKARGEGMTLTHSLQSIPPGYSVVTGVDLGHRVKESAALTCFFTLCCHPNGDREILDVTAGRWTGPEIVEIIVDIHYRYGSIIWVEDVAAQRFITQFVSKISSVPVKNFSTTGAKKASPEFGIESLAVEMYNGKWIIPCKNGICDPQVKAWIDELIYYDPNSHAGDRLMASWIAKEGARVMPKKALIKSIEILSR